MVISLNGCLKYRVPYYTNGLHDDVSTLMTVKCVDMHPDKNVTPISVH
jgi:hypothetical protein